MLTFVAVLLSLSFLPAHADTGWSNRYSAIYRLGQNFEEYRKLHQSIVPKFVERNSPEKWTGDNLKVNSITQGDVDQKLEELRNNHDEYLSQTSDFVDRIDARIAELSKIKASVTSEMGVLIRMRSFIGYLFQDILPFSNNRGLPGQGLLARVLGKQWLSEDTTLASRQYQVHAVFQQEIAVIYNNHRALGKRKWDIQELLLDLNQKTQPFETMNKAILSGKSCEEDATSGKVIKWRS